MNACEQWAQYAAAKRRYREQWANSGGPMSRRRTERVLASLLRDEAVQFVRSLLWDLPEQSFDAAFSNQS